MADQRGARTTVVIPVWDEYATARLEDAVSSIRTQDRSAEILVVDNASSVEIPAFEDTATVRCPSRVSLGAARNVGLEHVTTPYVIFWDADDLMLPGTVGFLEDELDRDTGLVAVGSAIVEEDSMTRHRWPRPWLATLTRAPQALALLDSVWSVFPTTGATAMRTAVVRDAGGYADSDSGEDWCLGVSLVFRGRVGWSERPGRLYLRRPESVWSRHSSARHQLHHAAVVRRRIRSDRAVPRWLRMMLPLVAVGQTGAVLGHLALARVRRV